MFSALNTQKIRIFDLGQKNNILIKKKKFKKKSTVNFV